MSNYNFINGERAEVPADATEAGEARQEENTEWKEQATPPEPIYGNDATNEEHVEVPVDATQTLEAREEEKIEWNEQPALIPQVVEIESVTWLNSGEIDELRSRWNSIQIEFVNDPRTSVEQADALVAEVLEKIEQAFSNKRTKLDEQWINHKDISTEDLRFALQSYRSFFNRLLAN
jgi:polyhydroxyalkanoate synthesis regulator phasin